MPVMDENKKTAVLDYPAFLPEQEFEKPTYPNKRFYLFIKRSMDLIFSLLGLLILSPIFLLAAIAIKLDSEGSIFYSQVRIGKKGKPFTMYKFRSMCKNADSQLKDLQALNERDGPTFKIRKDPRVTRVGSFMRKTCIDELPQLFNVLRGDMTLVGPRPPLVNEVEQYTDYQMGRLDVTPGLTCYWQVCVRDRVTFDEWVEMDLQYIRERGFWIDIKLIFRTFFVIFKHEGSK